MDKKPLILSVDDNPVNNTLLKTQLMYKDFEVISATSGKEALKIIAESKPDAVLLDLRMPDMDGYQVLEIIRENPETEKLPVIVISALADDEHHIEATMKGADAYLDKPFLSTVLVDELNRLLSNR